jgi:UDP:flavonoid glycosyltransferase YjiC (YdhE family)
VREFAPDVAVADILTPGPALAAELEDVPLATLVPHVHPFVGDGHPIYSIGARLPRTRFGRELWRWGNRRFVHGSLETGRDQYNDTRARLGLPPLPYVHTALSRELTMVGTLPQLEYPRRWAPWVRVVGPLQWEPPGERVEPPPGSGPVVLIAPSTSQDPSHSLLRASLEGLAGAPVRVIATYNGREPSSPIDVPSNAVLVPWLSYSKTMPLCDVVVLHGGHGTLVRALAAGCSVVACPAGGDMNENAARVDWAGLGVRLPARWLGARTLRLAVRRALQPEVRARVAALDAPDGALRACEELEAWAAHRRTSTAAG